MLAAFRSQAIYMAPYTWLIVLAAFLCSRSLRYNVVLASKINYREEQV